MAPRSALPRDLTDPEQNRAVLDAATALLDDPAAQAAVAAAHGPAVAAEAAAAARARRRLAAVPGPTRLTVVWAMYAETGRLVPRDAHPHGEDLVRVKVAQLDWLTAGLPVTWDVVACDDGCPDDPPSAAVMAGILAAEGLPTEGHRGVRVVRLADVLTGDLDVAPYAGPHLRQLPSTDASRKGGAVVAALATALRTEPPTGRHVVAYTDADLSADLAQLGSLVAALHRPDGGPPAVAALGQRYGMPGAVLVRPDGPATEPRSTGDKPDKLIVLLRHHVRALLVPDLAHVLDTQAGFKAFDAAALAAVLPEVTSCDETFDVELLVRLARHHGARALVVEPIVFTEDFAATNFPSVDPGPRHLAMLQQVADLHDRLVAPVAPATGAAAELLALVRGLDVDGYVRLVTRLRAADAGDPTLFDRRWPVGLLREYAAP